MGIAAFGYLLMGLALLTGAILAPIITRWIFRSHEIADDSRNIQAVHRATKNRLWWLAPSRDPGKYADPQIDDLLAAEDLGAAEQLIRERLRLAHEQGNPDRERLYRDYLQRVREHYTGA